VGGWGRIRIRIQSKPRGREGPDFRIRGGGQAGRGLKGGILFPRFGRVTLLEEASPRVLGALSVGELDGAVGVKMALNGDKTSLGEAVGDNSALQCGWGWG